MLPNTYAISWLLLGMIGASLAFSCAKKQEEEMMYSTSSQDPNGQVSSFPDYDWLPEALKIQMEELKKNDTTHRYSFYYFFNTNDINHHYYLEDRGLKVMAEMPVVNEQVLHRIEEKLYEIEVRRLGMFEARDTAPKQPGLVIFYVLPEGKVDFSQLRVAIMKDTVNREMSEYNFDTVMYDLEDVDIPPRPVRGAAYFKDAVQQEAQLEEVFALFDTGTVIVEFVVVGYQAQVLGVDQGFSNWDNSYEAYQAESEFMKAIHNAKVRWKPGTKNGQPVKTKMKMTFKIDSAKVNSFFHQLPSI